MIFSKFFALGSSLSVDEERFWRETGSGGMTATGLQVTPDLAFQTSVLFDGVRIIAETLGSLALLLYRRTDVEGSIHDGRERARTHPLWRTLRYAPNVWQTRGEWIEVMTAQAILWGQGLSQILSGPRGFAEALVPLVPELVTVEQLADSGRLRYRIIGREQPLIQDEVFRVRGFGAHRFMGANLIRLAREAVGLWLAMEKFGGLYFRQGASQRLLLEVPGKLTPEAYRQLKESINESVAGVINTGRALVATEGAKWSHVGFSARESQMTEAREAQVYEVARWLNLPPYMLGARDAMANASAEQRARQFVDITLRPWCTRWEQSIQRDLIPEDDWDDLFAEFLLESLLRGNTLDRFTAYGLGIMNGVLSENEARVRENLNPWPGLDEPRRSVNQDRGGNPNGPRQEVPPAAPSQSPPVEDPEAPAAALPGPSTDLAATRRAVSRRARLITEQSAERVVRKEISTIRARAPKFASDPVGWREWVLEFYEEHARQVGQALQLEPAIAQRYVSGHCVALLAGGVAMTDRWEIEAPAALVALAMEESDA